MSFLTFGLSTQCKNKEHVNQDRFGSVTVRSISGKEILIAAISDGVTMSYKGELASYNTVRFILNWGVEYFSVNEFDSNTVPEHFDELVTKINQSINSYVSKLKIKKIKEGHSPFSSCTLCCIITDGEKALHFSVGDSAIYELKTYRTMGILGKDGVNKHTNESGRLTSYIGGIEDSRLDIRYIESQFDDSSAFFICTDGMYNKIDFNVEKNEDFRKFNQRLLASTDRINGTTIIEGMADYVLGQGETDDITALVIKKV